MMKMIDVPIGDMVFREERIGDQVRETYYTRISEAKVTHHGCIQGYSTIPAEGDWEDDPDAKHFRREGFVYDIIGAMPVKPISESRTKFLRFICP